MKNLYFIISFLSLNIFSSLSHAVTYTSTGSGDWMTAGMWTPSGPPTSGLNAASVNRIRILAGHSIRISGEDIALSDVIVEIYGILIMDNQGGLSTDYANLNITGTTSGVIIYTGGTIDEDVLLAGNLNIRVNGTVVWNGGTTGDITATTNIYMPVSLPVEFVEWNVAASKHGMDATWSTASETNNDYFTLEESTDGINFYSITEIPSKGNTSALQEYYHTFSPKGKGILYFRLRQTDFDGKFSYSSIVSETSIETTTESEFTIFPNPITDKTFALHFANKNVNTISIKDLQSGQEILYQEFSEVDRNIIDINLPDYIKSGIYMLHITHNEGVDTKTMVVF